MTEPALARAPSGVPERLTPYMVFLLVYLSVVGFFDYFATVFRFSMPTYVRDDFGIGMGEMSRLLAWVYLGSTLAFVPRVLADVVGRRFMLWLTLASLCLFQFLIGYARTPIEFVALLTLLAVFYKSDLWMLVASEEAPPRDRGLCVAAPAMLSFVGALVCGHLIRNMGDAADAWRSVAKFPIWGLVISIPFALFMRETHHFRQARADRESRRGMRLLFAPFQRKWIKSLIYMSILRGIFVGVAINVVVLIGYEYLKNIHGYGRDLIGLCIQLEVIVNIVAVLSVGFLADTLGRRLVMTIFGLWFVVALSAFAFIPVGLWWVIPAHVAQSFAATAMYVALRFTTVELFPNDFRATAAAWTDLFMTLTAATTTWLIGWLIDDQTGNGDGVPLWIIFLVAATTVLVSLPLLRFIRETKGQKLEEVR